MKAIFPTETYGQSVLLMQIDTALLPTIAGKLTELTQQHIWVDTNSWRKAYNAIAEMLLMQNGIVESIDRLYRLVDSIHNGTTYTADSATPPVVTPAIPAAPGAPAGITAGLRRQLLDAQGILPVGWFGILGSRPATTVDVLNALRQSTPEAKDSLLSKLDLLGDASDVAGIYNAVKGTVADWATIQEEGGILATLVVSTMANAAMMGVQARQLDSMLTKLDRLIASLDGGATPAPTTNVIAELQSTNTLLG